MQQPGLDELREQIARLGAELRPGPVCGRQILALVVNGCVMPLPEADQAACEAAVLADHGSDSTLVLLDAIGDREVLGAILNCLRAQQGRD